MVTTRKRGTGVHEQIRRDIMAGRWRPGEKLKPVALAESYSTSTTVVREALTRLVGDHFIVIEPNRGFFVPTLSLDELRDLTEVRCRTESLALEWAVERGDLAWESELIATHHTLSRIPRRGPNDPEHVAEAWAQAHRDFHSKLIAACNLPVLTDLCRLLSDSTELYRRWAAPSPAASGRDVESEHQAILQATLDRDGVRASELLRAHYERTVDVVLQSGLVDGVSAPERAPAA